jgi:hypothetical protein
VIGAGLLEAGFTRADLESGRVSVEEAMLLNKDPQTLLDAHNWSAMRIKSHNLREHGRLMQGQETDLERWKRCGEYED